MKKHNLQVVEAQIKQKKYYLTHSINTQFNSPLHQNIQLFIHDVQSN